MNARTYIGLQEELDKIKPQIEVIDSNLRFKEVLNYLKMLVEANTVNKQLINTIYESFLNSFVELGTDLSMNLVNDLLFLMKEPSLAGLQVSNSKTLFEAAYNRREEYTNEFNPETIEDLTMLELKRYKHLFSDRRISTVYDTLDTNEDQDSTNLKLIERKIVIIEVNEELIKKVETLKRRIDLNRSSAIYLATIEVRDILRVLSTDADEVVVNELREILETIPSDDNYNEFVEEIRGMITEDEPTEG